MTYNGLISVVCSTYNRPEALKRTIESLLKQTDENFELLIADDGSDDRTETMVRIFASQSKKIRIQHVWHEDKGFRLAAIRNLACKSISGDYLLFIDGDCIASPHWIEMHRRLAEPGWTVSGQRILLSSELTNRYVHADALDIDWSFSAFLKLYRQNLINRPWPILHLPLGALRKSRKNNWKMIKGCNWGMWSRDLSIINGFDEEFQGWGHEDSDVAVRLLNSGVHFKNGAYTAPVLHLWHPEASRDRSGGNWDKVLYRLRNKVTQPAQGMSKTSGAV